MPPPSPLSSWCTSLIAITAGSLSFARSLCVAPLCAGFEPFLDLARKFGAPREVQARLVGLRGLLHHHVHHHAGLLWWAAEPSCAPSRRVLWWGPLCSHITKWDCCSTEVGFAVPLHH